MFRTTTLRAPEAPRVDRERKVIFGASLFQTGDINDERPYTADEASLENALSLMQKGNNGTKARFAHPNMSADGMGSFLGRWKNPRIEGDTLRADLHLAEQAFSSPQGDLGTYVMDMAEKDPDMFGVSLATRLDDKAMEQLRAERLAEDPKWRGRTPMRFRAIHAADIVDDPAATRGGFFSLADVDNRNLPAQATMLLDTYFGDAEPEVVTARINGFLATYFRSKGLKMTDATVTETESTASASSTAPVVTVDLESERKAAADLARSEERNRITQIHALCKRAGKESLADSFCERGLSVAEVQGELFNALCASNSPIGDDGNSAADETPDENAKYKAEFSEARKQGFYSSLTEEQYVSLRRAEEGLEPFVK